VLAVAALAPAAAYAQGPHRHLAGLREPGRGQYGTLLLAIDRGAQAGYLYAVGHANGASTVIRGLGRAPATFGDPICFRWTAGRAGEDPLPP